MKLFQFLIFFLFYAHALVLPSKRGSVKCNPDMTAKIQNLFKASLLDLGFTMTCDYTPDDESPVYVTILRGEDKVGLPKETFFFSLKNYQTFKPGQELQVHLELINIDMDISVFQKLFKGKKQANPKDVIRAYHTVGRLLQASRTIYSLDAVTNSKLNGAQTWINFGYTMTNPKKDMSNILPSLKFYLGYMGYDNGKIESICTPENLQTVQDIQNKVTAAALGGPQVKYDGTGGVRDVEPGFAFLRDPNGTLKLKDKKYDCGEVVVGWNGQKVV